MRQSVERVTCSVPPERREGLDCDRVNGTVDFTRPLLHLAQIVRWYAFGRYKFGYGYSMFVADG